MNRPIGGNFTGNNNVNLEGNLQNSYVVWEQEQQQIIIAEQDEVVVLNLKKQAHEMEREPEEQIECARHITVVVAVTNAICAP